MSCSDPIKNIDAKEATYYTLSNLYNLYNLKGGSDATLKPNTKENPFPSSPDATLFANINTNLDDLDNNSKKSVRPTLRVQDILNGKINVPFTIPKSTKIDEAISYLVKNRLSSVMYLDISSFCFVFVCIDF